jgi:hypothetical protein
MCRSDLLGDAEYGYDADPYPQQLVSHWVSPPLEEEEEVVEASVLPVEQYQPPDLSKEEALRQAIEKNELVELDNLEGLGAQLAALVALPAVAPMRPAATPPDHRRRQLPSPSPGATPSGRCAHSGKLGALGLC